MDAGMRCGSDLPAPRRLAACRGSLMSLKRRAQCTDTNPRGQRAVGRSERALLLCACFPKAVILPK